MLNNFQRKDFDLFDTGLTKKQKNQVLHGVGKFKIDMISKENANNHSQCAVTPRPSIRCRRQKNATPSSKSGDEDDRNDSDSSSSTMSAPLKSRNRRPRNISRKYKMIQPPIPWTTPDFSKEVFSYHSTVLSKKQGVHPSCVFMLIFKLISPYRM